MSKTKSKKPAKAEPTPVKKAKHSARSKPAIPTAAEHSPAMQAGLAAVAALPPSPPKESKLALVIKLLTRPEGATIDDMVAATSWQKHTVRAALSHALAKKRGYKIVSDKPQGGQRLYKIAESA